MEWHSDSVVLCLDGAFFSTANVPTVVLALGLFPVQLRVTLFGLCYNMAQVIFGATAPFIENGLTDAIAPKLADMPNTLTMTEALSYACPAVWNMVAGAITLFGFWFYAHSVDAGAMEPSQIDKR